MGVLSGWLARRAERAADARADHYAAVDADVAEAREAAGRTEYALAVAPGIYVDQAGGYVYSSAFLLRLAERCRHVDTAQVESLLWIAAQQAQDAQGVPPLVVPLTEAQVVRPLEFYRLAEVA